MLRADARALPLEAESVDLVISSPPYFALRSYRDGDEHYDGQIGSEDTPAHFLAALWSVLDECWRVLKPEGSCWINLGDKFAGSGGHNNAGLSPSRDRALESGQIDGNTRASRRQAPDRYNQASDVRPKSRMLLPHRFALGCIDPEYREWMESRNGLHGSPMHQWICRMDLVWSKPNGMPESVTDRPRASHEYWFHLVKSERYYANLDMIRSIAGGVEAGAQGLPLCTLCGRPADPLAAHVGRGQERVGRVVSVGVPDQVGPDQGVEGEAVGGAEDEHEGHSTGSTVPLLVGGHAGPHEDGSHLVDDGPAAVVDGQAQVGARAIASVAQVDGRLAVDDARQPRVVRGATCECHSPIIAPLGKLPGSVWEIPSEPLVVPDELGVDHFAAFPTEWPRRLILGWSPPGICTACGEGRRAVVDATPMVVRPSERRAEAHEAGAGSGRTTTSGTMTSPPTRTITGEQCACPTPDAPTRPAVVLDPFGGTGTTAMIARALGRHGISVDLSADYLRLAEWRIFRSGHWLKAAERSGVSAAGLMCDEAGDPIGELSLFG